MPLVMRARIGLSGHRGFCWNRNILHLSRSENYTNVHMIKKYQTAHFRRVNLNECNYILIKNKVYKVQRLKQGT